LAFPALIFLLTVVTFLGQNLIDVVITLGVLSVAPIARIIRANTLVFTNREFVLRGQGARRRGDHRILPPRDRAQTSCRRRSRSRSWPIAVVIVARGRAVLPGLSVRPPTPDPGAG